MGELFELVFDLYGQFAGRYQHQGARGVIFAAVLGEFNDGDRECGRLAGARAGLTQNVAPFEGPRNDSRLNWRGVFVARSFERCQH